MERKDQSLVFGKNYKRYATILQDMFFKLFNYWMFIFPFSNKLFQSNIIELVAKIIYSNTTVKLHIKKKTYTISFLYFLRNFFSCFCQKSRIISSNSLKIHFNIQKVTNMQFVIGVMYIKVYRFFFNLILYLQHHMYVKQDTNNFL